MRAIIRESFEPRSYQPSGRVPDWEAAAARFRGLSEA
jgi:hypothetical protein